MSLKLENVAGNGTDCLPDDEKVVLQLWSYSCPSGMHERAVLLGIKGKEGEEL
jgi:hypothetical protein